MLVLGAAPSHTFYLPISLNSLDRQGVRLLSPRDSQFTSKLDAGTDATAPDDALERYHRSLHLVLEVICESQGLSNLTPS